MIFKNKTIQKSISFLIIVIIIIPFLFLSTPKKTNAFLGVGDISIDPITNIETTASTAGIITQIGLKLRDIAKEVFRQTLMTIARRMLADLTASTVGWINTGHFGQPLFLTNPESFFKDIYKGQIKNFIDRIGYDPNRFPFGRQYALQVLDSYRRQFEDNASYSLSVATTVPDLAYQRAYRENFNVGGWNGFLLNTQYPQNNPIGFSFIATEVLGRNLAGTTQSVAERVNTTLQQGSGFLSPQICVDQNENKVPGTEIINPYNPPVYNQSSFTPSSAVGPEPDGTDSKYTKPNGSFDSVSYTYDYNAWVTRYNAESAETRRAWNAANTCNPPNRRITTTPGAIAANRIMEVLGTTQKQGELSAALGNSLSAVFDALINKFMNQGLNALASVISPAPDDWTYEGQSLGVSPDGTNGDDDWRNRSDEMVSVADFKKELAGRTIIKNPIDGTILDDVIGVYSQPYDVQITNPDGTYYFVPADKIYTPGAIANTEEELLLMDNKNWDSSYDQHIIDPDPSKIAGIAQWMKQIPNQVKTLDQCLPGPDKGWEERLENEKQRHNQLFAETFSGAGEDQGNVSQTLNVVVSIFKDYVIDKMITSLPNAPIFMDEIKKLDTFTEQTRNLTTSKREKSSTLLRLKSILASLNSAFPTNIDPTSGSTGERNLLTLRRNYLAVRESISSASSIENTRIKLKTLLDEYDYLAILVPQCNAERININAGWISIPSGDPNLGQAFKLPSEVGKAYTLLTQRNTVCTGCADPLVVDETPKTTTGTEVEQFCELPLIGGHDEGEVLVPGGISGINEGNDFGDPLFRHRTRMSDGNVMFPFMPVVNAVNIKAYKKHVVINCKLLWKANNINYTHAGDPSF